MVVVAVVVYVVELVRLAMYAVVAVAAAAVVAAVVLAVMNLLLNLTFQSLHCKVPGSPIFNSISCSSKLYYFVSYSLFFD